MDDKKKIVLGSEDFLAKGIDDIYININLQQTFNQIKKDKYDNNFDLAQQFREERNASRDFRIYGIVDSTITDTNNMTIRIYKDSGLTQVHSSVNTSSLAYEEDNVFDKIRGKFLIELNSYDEDVVYFTIQGDGFTYADQVFEQRLVFYTLDGEFVEYGTETIDIGLNNPGFLEIENDFPFFYNKHWIKKDLNIIETKPVIMQFGTESSVAPEGSTVAFDIVLDKPSPFGNESVVVDAVLGTVAPADYNLTIGGNVVNFPITLTWVQGEQNKTFEFDAIADDVYEFSENMFFNLYNFSFAESGLTTTHFVEIQDTTPRKFTNYHLGEIYKNRLEYSGRTAQYNVFSGPSTYSGYAVLRNGTHYVNDQLEFYPGDTYDLYVTNRGIDTILPINPNFGINTESIWPAGEDRLFSLDTDYTGDEKHKVKIIFPQGAPSNLGDFRINGVQMNVPFGELNYTWVKQRIVDGLATDWIPFNGYEKDWTATADDAEFSITITSKSSGKPVVVDMNATAGPNTQFPSGTSPIDPAANPILEEIDPYVEREQIPKVLKLYANANNNTKTFYEFQFVKQGYNGVSISAKTHTATSSGVNRYLVTTFEDIVRNWSDTEDNCIYSTGTTAEIGFPVTELPNGEAYPENYFWPVEHAYINGSVLLQGNIINLSRQNLTSFRTADFKNYPLIVKPCTASEFLVESLKQRSRLTIPPVGQDNEVARQLYEDNAYGFRSFDFRTGTTGPYTTYYRNNSSFYTFNDIDWRYFISLSGGTTGTATFLNHPLDYGSTTGGNLFPEGPLLGYYADGTTLLTELSWSKDFVLESKQSGVPFEITNIVNAYVHTTADASPYVYEVFAGEIISPIKFETLVPNGVAGVDLNVARNWMGGYNTDLQIGPGGLPGGGGGTGPIIGTTPPLVFTTL